MAFAMGIFLLAGKRGGQVLRADTCRFFGTGLAGAETNPRERLDPQGNWDSVLFGRNRMPGDCPRCTSGKV